MSGRAPNIQTMTSHPSGIWIFPKLKGRANYRLWAMSMQTALLYEDYWGVTKDDAGYPQSWFEEHGGYYDDGEPIVTRKAPTREELNEIEREQVRWEDQNAKARALMMYKCEESPRDLIEDVDKAHEQWSKLQKLYQDSGFTSQHITFQELLSTSLSSCGNSVDRFAMTIRAKAKDLEKMNAKLPDWVVVSLLLNNLEGKYRDFTHRTITTIKTSEPDVEGIITMLYQEDRARRS